MIARTWHGMVPKSKADAYFDYLQQTGVRDLAATAGNRGVFVLRRVAAEEAHFLLLSLWDSLEAIKAFAGEEIEKARYYPEDKEFLLELEPTVTHYEVLRATTGDKVLDVEFSRDELVERFIREDVEWGLHGDVGPA
jgi:heme-degrading monooxygenase HmoA